MDIYLIQRLTSIHYMLIVLAILAGMFTIALSVLYFISRAAELSMKKDITRNFKWSFVLTIVLTCCVIFVPTTNEYYELAKINKKELQESDTVKTITMPSDSDKSVINALIKNGNKVEQYSKYKSIKDGEK